MNSCTTTLPGKKLKHSIPSRDHINIFGIAHSLSLRCHSNCRDFFSVAQQSVILSRALPEELRMDGLLYHATEEYKCDARTPITRTTSANSGVESRVLESHLINCIGAAFDIRKDPWKLIKDVDSIVASAIVKKLSPQPIDAAPANESDVFGDLRPLMSVGAQTIPVKGASKGTS